MNKPNYIIKRTTRKSISLEIDSALNVLVRAPKSMSDYKIRKFIKSHEKWTLIRLSEKDRQDKMLTYYCFSKDEMAMYKTTAEKKVNDIAKLWAKELGVRYKKVRISNAKKRWGSCSSKGTVSINWRLIFAPKKTLVYVIIHELMHLKHMNHSKKYWQAVEKAIPDYKNHKKWLKDHEYILRIE